MVNRTRDTCVRTIKSPFMASTLTFAGKAVRSQSIPARTRTRVASQRVAATASTAVRPLRTLVNIWTGKKEWTEEMQVCRQETENTAFVLENTRSDLVSWVLRNNAAFSSKLSFLRGKTWAMGRSFVSDVPSLQIVPFHPLGQVHNPSTAAQVAPFWHWHCRPQFWPNVPAGQAGEKMKTEEEEVKWTEASKKWQVMSRSRIRLSPC